jgi:hypothetical protein
MHVCLSLIAPDPCTRSPKADNCATHHACKSSYPASGLGTNAEDMVENGYAWGNALAAIANCTEHSIFFGRVYPAFWYVFAMRVMLRFD